MNQLKQFKTIHKYNVLQYDALLKLKTEHKTYLI
jgi:hypothetical protein